MCESTATSPLPGKCLAVASTPVDWLAAMAFAPIAATSSGLSPYDLTPMAGLPGLLFTSRTGARFIFKPSCSISSAVTLAARRA
ncbi:MAG: hypothetical protein BWY85_02319 [Firmicutes bacterium ADurb.Bin506]|nr:MAG: hypothetical protein BWY85_02319 [Firmicutes bacterium ADurb.Bin506]